LKGNIEFGIGKWDVVGSEGGESGIWGRGEDELGNWSLEKRRIKQMRNGK